jgi:dipeptidyl aminopeptidase/acylaminoacyl peptidase
VEARVLKNRFPQIAAICLLLLLDLLRPFGTGEAVAGPSGFTLGHARRLRSVGRPALSPDGKLVAYVLDGAEIRVSPAGGGASRAVPWDGRWVSRLGWLPDGKALTFLAADDERITQVWVLPLDGSQTKPVTREWASVVEYAWTRDARRLAVLTQESRRESMGYPLAIGRSGRQVDLSFDGADLREVILLFSTFSKLSVVVDPDVRGSVHARFHKMPWQNAFERLLESHGLGYTVRDRVLRVGRRAVLRADNQAVHPQDRPIVINGASFKREGVGYLPSYGRRLVVWEMPQGRQSVVPNVPQGARDLTWSPNGQLVAFAGAGNGGWDVFLASPFARRYWCLAGSRVNEDSPSFTPDGVHVVYRVDGSPDDPLSTTHRLAMVPAAGGESRLLPGSLDREIEDLQVAPDSRHAWFLLPDQGTVSLARARLADGRVDVVVGGDQEITGFDVAAGGQVALVSSTMSRPPAVLTLAPARPLRTVSDPNATVVGGLHLPSARRILARSGSGPQVEAFFLPARGSGAGRARPPAVVWLHGGPYAQQAAGFDPFWHLLSEAGIAVILPNPSGSTGRGHRFSASIQGAWGTHDYDDVMAVVDEAVREGLVDGERLGVGGWSYGGFLTNEILTRTDRFKAAVSGASLSNMLTDYGVSDTAASIERELGLPWKAAERYIAASPVFRVDRVRTPTLVLCGQDDMRTPLAHSEQWYRALKRVGVEAQLVIYPNEGHSPSDKAWEDVMARSLGWYARRLRPSPRSAGAGDRAGHGRS